MAKRTTFQTKFRLWIYAGDEKLLGPGRVEIMERIHRTGSIQKAALEMGMSYRQAWKMVTEINERAGQPYVEKHLGGKGGGGAIVTEAGLKAIAEFNRMEQRIRERIEAEFKKTSFADHR
ncbi:MAG: LysR family transcriptional regulator [Flavobacteriales bacterium]|nr:LysR family transcriptional regulator [Flavobacteriales bacterium]